MTITWPPAPTSTTPPASSLHAAPDPESFPFAEIGKDDGREDENEGDSAPEDDDGQSNESPAPSQRQEVKHEKINVFSFGKIKIVRPQWLWPGRIPANKLTIVEGDPETGKSSVCIDIVARATTGRPFPDEPSGTEHEPINALWLTVEDDPSEVLKPRLVAAGADVARVFGAEDIPKLSSAGDVVGINVERLREAILDHNAKLLVLDPGSMTVDESLKESAVRPAMAALFGISSKTGCTPIWIRHLIKSGDAARAMSNPLMLGGGSIGIVAAVRSSQQVHIDRKREAEGHPHFRVLGTAKSNLSLHAAPMWFGFEDATVNDPEAGAIETYRISWGDPDPDMTLRDVLAANAAHERNGRPGSGSGKVERALLVAFQKSSTLTSAEVASILVRAGVPTAKEKGPSQWRGWSDFAREYEVEKKGSTRATAYTMKRHLDFNKEEGR